MAFNIFKWLFNKDTQTNQKVKVNIEAYCSNLATEIYIRELAFHMISNKIGNALSKCELNFYKNNKKVKDEEWYRWNVQPNKNQNATQFWNKLIDKLYNDNEALVVENSNELYVADSYLYNDDSAFFEHYFEGVTVNNFTFGKRFYMSEVFYFKLNNKDLKTFIDGTLVLYGKLINASLNNYLIANGNKGVLYIDEYNAQEEDFETTLSDILNNQFKKFFESANSVIPLYNGYEYKPLESKGNLDTRDFKALLDDVISITANAFNVPKTIAIGEVQDTSKAIDEFLTFCLDPLIELLTDEITRKLYDKWQIIEGFYAKFDTKAVKHIDLLDVATAIDKLISSGCFTINDIRKVCGEDEINEDWANQFFMTKNYSAIEDIVNQLKGGEST